MKLYNTRSKSIEQFVHETGPVTIYACGPTVYDYAHIGNFRTYVLTDIVVRTLRYLGYGTKYVMNITDVGHLTTDADTGEDKMEKGSRREGKDAWQTAAFFTERFLEDSRALNLIEPDIRPTPTKHIPEQVALIASLLEKKHAYIIDDGVYFDTSTFPSYGELWGQDRKELLEGARVEANPSKRNPTDFALWKFSGADSKRQMEWDSPWGKGFPGWHIECSAMCMKYLGASIDIHTGGMDLIPIHHTNEIAQSESVTGQHPFVRYWIHGQFLQVDGGKMSKSAGNFYRLSDITARGLSPLALRYFYFTAHYRSYLNFTWDAITAADNSLRELKRLAEAAREQAKRGGRQQLSREKSAKVDGYRDAFRRSVGDDLNMPKAVSVVWEMVKSNIPSGDKVDLIADFDEVMGFGLLIQSNDVTPEVPEEIRSMVSDREAYRAQGAFDKADESRKQIESLGYTVEDTPDGPVVRKR